MRSGNTDVRKWLGRSSAFEVITGTAHVAHTAHSNMHGCARIQWQSKQLLQMSLRTFADSHV